jgi:hypothetical protein
MGNTTREGKSRSFQGYGLTYQVAIYRTGKTAGGAEVRALTLERLLQCT